MHRKPISPGSFKTTLYSSHQLPTDLYSQLYDYYLSANNTLEQLIELYPDAPWDWRLLSNNPEVSYEFILDHPELPWQVQFLGASLTNRGQNTSFIDKYGPLRQFDLNKATKLDPNLIYDLLDDRTLRSAHYLYKLESNLPLDYHIVKDYYEEGFPWVLHDISINKYISTYDLVKLADNVFHQSMQNETGEHSYYFYRAFFDDPKILLSYDPDLYRQPYIFEQLSYNPHIDVDYIRKHLRDGWRWTALVYNNKAITWKDIVNNPDLFSVYPGSKGVSSLDLRPNVEGLDDRESWKWYRYNTNIRNAMKEKIPKTKLPDWFYYKTFKKYNYENDTEEIILVPRYENMPLYIEDFIRSPNLTWKMIADGLDPANNEDPVKWNWKILSERGRHSLR